MHILLTHSVCIAGAENFVITSYSDPDPDPLLIDSKPYLDLHSYIFLAMVLWLDGN